MNCDPACIKTILNGGLVAEDASLLADMVGPEHPMYVPARDLARVALAVSRTHDFLTLHGALVKTGDASVWDGCEHSAKIMSWINAIENGDAAFAENTAQRAAAISTMRKWKRDLLKWKTTIAEGTMGA